MIFTVTTDPTNQEYSEYGGFVVSATSPNNGGDSALVAVFDSKAAAIELADVLNHAALLLSWHRNPETMGK